MLRKINLMLVAVLIFCMCGCGNSENKTTFKQVVSGQNFTFDSRNTLLTINYGNREYNFNNKYKPYVKDFSEFLNEFEIKSVNEPQTTDEYVYVRFLTSDWERIGIFFYTNDVIELNIGHGLEKEFFISEDIFEKIKEYLEPILSETDLYYKKGTTPVTQRYEYAVYDEERNVLVCEISSRTPHITRESEDIICLWIQGGTGIYSRWSVYYNHRTGEISPTYNGQTDSYGTLTCNTGSGVVEVSDIFSGEVVYTIDNFDEPIGDFVENISSAYFSEDGSQIIVEYLNTEVETCQQVYKLPASIVKK